MTIKSPSQGAEVTVGQAFSIVVEATGGIPTVVLSVPGQEAVTATVIDEAATFNNVVLSTVGDATLRVTVSGFADQVCSAGQCDEVTVSVLPDAGDAGTCYFTSPADQGTVTQDAYANQAGDTSFDPVEIDLIGRCVGVEDNTRIFVTLNGEDLGEVLVTNSGFRVERQRVVQGENVATVTVGEEQATSTFYVSTGECIVVLELGDGDGDTHGATTPLRLTSANDTEPGLPGLQYDFSITTDCTEGSQWRLQWATVADEPRWSNVDGGAGFLNESLGAGAQQTTTKYRIDGALLRLPESDDWENKTFYLIARVEDETLGKTGFSSEVEFDFDSKAPDIGSLIGNSDPLSDLGNFLGVADCWDGAANNTADGKQVDLSGTIESAADGTVWVRAYDSNSPFAQCTAAEGVTCSESDPGYSPGTLCVADTDGAKYCRRRGVADADGVYTISGLVVPFGESVLEYMAVDDYGNKSEVLSVLQDVVADAGVHAPQAAVLQVGTKVLNTLESGSFVANSGVSDTLNIGDKSASSDATFPVDVVVGTVNVPLGSTVSISVGASTQQVVLDETNGSFATSQVTFTGLALAHFDGLTANNIDVSISGPARARDEGYFLQCFPGSEDTVAAAVTGVVSMKADNGTPVINPSSIKLGADYFVTTGLDAEASDNCFGDYSHYAEQPAGAKGRDTNNDPSSLVMDLSGTLVSSTEAGSTATLTLSAPCSSECEVTVDLTANDAGDIVNFVFPAVTWPATDDGAALEVTLVITDANGNLSEAVRVPLKVLSTVPNPATFALVEPIDGGEEFVFTDLNSLEAGTQYSVSATSTPGAVTNGPPELLVTNNGLNNNGVMDSDGGEAWSKLISLDDGVHALTITHTDACEIVHSRASTMVVYGTAMNATTTLTFSDDTAVFTGASTGALRSDGTQLAIAVDTGTAPVALQGMDESQFFRKVTYAIYDGAAGSSSCGGTKVQEDTTSADTNVGASEAGTSFGTFDLTNVNGSDLTDGDVCVEVTVTPLYGGVEATTLTESFVIGFEQRSTALAVVRIDGPTGQLSTDGPSVCQFALSDDATDATGFNLNLTAYTETFDSVEGTLKLAVLTGTADCGSAEAVIESAAALTAGQQSAAVPAGGDFLSLNWGADYTFCVSYDDGFNESTPYSVSCRVPSGGGPTVAIDYPQQNAGEAWSSSQLNQVIIGYSKAPGDAEHVAAAACNVQVGDSADPDRYFQTTASWVDGSTTLTVDLTNGGAAPISYDSSTPVIVLVACDDVAGNANPAIQQTVVIDDSVPLSPTFSNSVFGSVDEALNTPEAPSRTYSWTADNFVLGECSFRADGASQTSNCVTGSTGNLTFRVDANGEVPADLSLTASITYGDGNTNTYEVESLTESGDVLVNGGSGAVSFTRSQAFFNSNQLNNIYLVTLHGVIFGDGEQDLNFSVVVTDAASNATEPVTETARLDRVRPTIAQTIPDYVDPLTADEDPILGVSADAFAGNTELLDLAFAYSTTGVDNGATVSLTVTHDGELEVVDLFSELQVDGDSYSGINGQYTIEAAANDSGVVSFPRITFPDRSGYQVAVAVTDAAGNQSNPYEYHFRAQFVQPSFVWDGATANNRVLNLADDASGTTAGLQTTPYFTMVGFQPGTTVTLCASSESLAATGEPCRWGYPNGSSPGGAVEELPGTTGLEPGLGADNTVFRGYKIGEIDANSGVVSFTAATFPEGQDDSAYWVHAEAVDPTGNPDLASEFIKFTVDSVPPAVTALRVQNDSGLEGTMGISELTSSGSGYTVGVEVDVAFAADLDGRAVTILRNGVSTGVTGTLSGGSPDTPMSATVLGVPVEEGDNIFTATLTDPLGNESAGSASVSVFVDVSAPTLSLNVPSPASGSVFNTGDVGTPFNDAGGNQVVILNGDITVGFTADASLEGSTVSINTYQAETGGTALYAEPITATITSSDATQAVFSAAGGNGIQFRAGLQYIEVNFADALGNASVTPARVPVSVDFDAPVVSLSLFTGDSNATSTCASAATDDACRADLLDLGGGAYQDANLRCTLDRNAATTCPADLGTPGSSDCSSDNGTDMQYTLDACTGDGASDNSGVGACSIALALQSRVGSGTWATADNGSFTATANASGASILAAAAAANGAEVLHNPGIVREFRLTATDANGNTSTSSTIFLKLNNSGTTLEASLVHPSTGALTSVSSGLAIASAMVDSSTVDLSIVVTPTVGSETPVSVSLAVNGVSTGSTYGLSAVGDGSYTTTATDITIPTVDTSADAGFSIEATINCVGGITCGGATFANLVADTTSPTYQFSRCDLVTLGVPMDTGDGFVCANESASPTVAANINQGSTAVWSQATESGSASDTNFTLGGLDVELFGLASNPQVTLTATVEGGSAYATATTTATGCADDDSGTACVASFDMDLPQQNHGVVTVLTVSFADSAGNAAAPLNPRTDASEKIRAQIDAVAPAAFGVTACLGESTTPASVGTPSADPATFEDASCSTACSGRECSRLKGSVVLAFTAPGDDGTTAGGDIDYNVKVAALHRGYEVAGVDTYTACSQLTSAAVNEQTASVNANSFLTVGDATTADGTTYIQVSGLRLHASYCFAVEAQDDAGNKSDIAGEQVERELFLLNAETAIDFDPADPALDVGSFLTDVSSQDVSKAAPLADFDGDGEGDLAVATTGGSVLVYLSRNAATGNTYPITISKPVNSDGSFFGYVVKAGDHDGDGLSDLILADANAAGVGGAASNGAMHIYYGVDDTANAGGSAWWEQSPSNDNQTTPPASATLLLGAGLYGGLTADMVELNGTSGQELVYSVAFNASFKTDVWGIAGGSKLTGTLDVVSGSAGAGEVGAYFQLGGYSASSSIQSVALSFGTNFTSGDFDGDGDYELVVNDPSVAHSPTNYPGVTGEVYVIEANSLSGTGLTLDGLGASVTTLRHPSSSLVAASPHVSTNPTGGGADWLFLKTNADILQFKGASGAGITPSSYPAEDLDSVTYFPLGTSSFDGTNFTSNSGWGNASAPLNLAGVARIMFWDQFGNDPAAPMTIYRYSAGAGQFVLEGVVPNNETSVAQYPVSAGQPEGASFLMVLDNSGSNKGTWRLK